MPLKPGEPHDLSSSMALAIKDAWEHHWLQVMPGRRVPLFGPFLDVLFVAIAQGVVRHLQENPTAFDVVVDSPSGGGNAFGEVHTVATEGVRPAAVVAPTSGLL